MKGVKLLLALRYKVEKCNRNSDEKNGKNPINNTVSLHDLCPGGKKFSIKKKALYFCGKWKEIYDTERF